MIEYRKEENLSADEFTGLLQSSTLGERRPVDDPGRIARMIRNANLVITARDGGKLIGVARSISDFSYCTYLSDLAVDVHYQKQGIGKELIRFTWEYSKQAKLILLSAPAAVDYYPHIGMKRHDHCYYLDDGHELK